MCCEESHSTWANFVGRGYPSGTLRIAFADPCPKHPCRICDSTMQDPSHLPAQEAVQHGTAQNICTSVSSVACSESTSAPSSSGTVARSTVRAW